MSKVTRDEMLKWENRWSFFFYGSLVLVAVGIVGLELVDKETAKALVWYWAGFTAVFGTIGFIVGSISGKKTSQYFQQQYEDIKERHGF